MMPNDKNKTKKRLMTDHKWSTHVTGINYRINQLDSGKMRQEHITFN